MASLVSRFSAVSILLGLFACGTPPSTDDSSSGSEGLKVVTTFLPITLFTEAVAGECADVTSLIPPSLGPHDFQASPSDLAALSQASVLVQNGLGIEEFLDELVAVLVFDEELVFVFLVLKLVQDSVKQPLLVSYCVENSIHNDIEPTKKYQNS